MTDQAIESGDLRIVFHSRGDRYGHTVEKRIEGEWRPLLESVEGKPGDEWPPSPPLQSLQIESRPNGPVALLVGMAGKSHWSASVEMLPDHRGFSFDIACLVNQQLEHIGSRYRPVNLDASASVAVCIEPCSAPINQDARGEWTIIPREVVTSLPCTTRWRYQLRASD